MTEAATDVRHEASTTEPLYLLDDVTFEYPNGGVRALEGLTLPIPRGAKVGVIGPSGCGKSTLLFLLAGLWNATEGKVQRNLDSNSTRHPMTMVFQKDTLLPWLTVTENVKLFYKYHPVHGRAERKEVDDRVAQLIGMASLRGFEDSYPHHLSGGMRKRVSLLSAIAPLPETLLLDEPFSSLDEPTRVGLHQDLLNITKQLDMTVVLVTHDLAEAVSLCDTVSVLRNRPAAVFSTHEIPFGNDRTVLDLRQDPDFLEAYGQLWHDLSQQILLSKNDEPIRRSKKKVGR